VLAASSALFWAPAAQVIVQNTVDGGGGAFDGQVFTGGVGADELKNNFCLQNICFGGQTSKFGPPCFNRPL